MIDFAHKLKVRTGVEKVHHSFSNDREESFLVSGRGYVMVAVVNKKTHVCTFYTTSGKYVKDIKL